MNDFLGELRRRGVLKNLIGYVGLVWLVVQVLETTFPIFDLHERYIQWVIIAAVILVVPVATLSWIFEWSATGLTTQKQLDASPPIERPHSRRSDLIVIGILSLALTYFKVASQDSAHLKVDSLATG